MRHENKHKGFKAVARVSNSRKNLPFTLALKNQLQQQSYFSSNQTSTPAPAVGPVRYIVFHEMEEYNDFRTILVNFPISEKIRCCKWI